MHLKYMKLAYEEALKAFEQGEVPIGAIVVYEDQIIGKGFNRRQHHHHPFGHAEVEAINEAAQFLGSWNLTDCTLYVTVEPCPMCAGALIQSQCTRVVYGASEPNSGSLGSIVDLSKLGYNHSIEVISGVMERECKLLMQEFFKKLRSDKVKVKRISDVDFKDYLKVRTDVFVIEQKVPIELEIDELDTLEHNGVIHIGAFINDTLVGTSRLIKDGKDLKVGRVAVLKAYRKQGVGEAMLRYAEVQAQNNGFQRLKLGAQLSAIPFYEKSGYIAEGDIYLDANIEHRDMVKLIVRK